MLLGWLFVPVYHASGVFTMPEYMKKRLGQQRIRVLLSIISLVIYVLTKLSVTLFHGKSTYLGSRIWYFTVWKISNFSATLTLRKINFGSFQKVKTVILQFRRHWSSELLKWPKLQFFFAFKWTNWFRKKSEWHKNHETSTLCILN